MASFCLRGIVIIITQMTVIMITRFNDDLLCSFNIKTPAVVVQVDQDDEGVATRSPG